jgi:hypothetical protein
MGVNTGCIFGIVSAIDLCNLCVQGEKIWRKYITEVGIFQDTLSQLETKLLPSSFKGLQVQILGGAMYRGLWEI